MDQNTFTTGPAGTFSISPSGVYTQFEHGGQTVTVVKLHDAAGHAQGLQQDLVSRLGLAAQAPLLVLRSEGAAVLELGQAQALYDQYLSKKTDAVSSEAWQPLPA